MLDCLVSPKRGEAGCGETTGVALVEARLLFLSVKTAGRLAVAEMMLDQVLRDFFYISTQLLSTILQWTDHAFL